MKAIISHPNLDFDALASMVAAQKLYPDAVLVTVGKPATKVRNFIVLYGNFIEIKNYIDKKDIDTLIMVDTRSKQRLLEFGQVLENENIEVIVYDHHESSDDDIVNANIYQQALGANVTQLVELIRERKLTVTPQEATVFALGIYDDTGSLRFSSTTERDLLAAAWLLSQGANLGVIAEFTELSFTVEQSELFGALLNHSVIRTIHKKDILIATAKTERFINDLASLTMKVKEVYAVDAICVVVRMENRIHIVGRSATKEINIREVLANYGGRGHIMAASAMLKDVSFSLSELAEALFRAFAEHIPSPLTVKKLMSTPVKTISPHITVNEVGEYMLRYGHSAYPVVENDRLTGMISRRDVDKCKYHGLGNVPVKGYMSHNVITVSPDTLAEDARELLIKKNIGHLPVVENEALIGIVTRTDLLRTLYGQQIVGGHQLTYTKNSTGEERVNLLQALEKAVSREMFQILGKISALADREGLHAFLVGGLVRDLLLGENSVDFDIVVEGDGIAFAEDVAVLLCGTLSAYPKFGTATVVIDGVIKIDVAGARTEFYEYPAAAPKVEQGSLKQDLFRRDFTVNAMALSLNFETFGQLIDYYNGREDLEHKKIRVLHNLSFVEDPTRILRALRFEARYGFAMTEETRGFALKAIEDGVLANLSRRRIWHETDLALQEDCAFQILAKMEEYRIWPYLFPGYAFDASLKDGFEKIIGGNPLFQKALRKPNLPLLRFLLLVFPQKREDINTFFEEAQLPRSYRDAVWSLKDQAAMMTAEDEDFSELAWYTLMAETPPEVLIALYAKVPPLWQRRLLEAFFFYREQRIFCTKQEIRGLEGYERGTVKEILTDLLVAKKKGNVPTKEEELAYIRENLKNGKYKGEMDV
ncbi:MAG TPA: CBS domain-containing protein [Clostridiales bacterium]|nr:CBS domain-containing protein [Clostridiales bacterium]